MEISVWSQIYLNDSFSPIMNNLIFFHEHAMFIIILIISLILYMMLMMMFNKFNNRFLMKGHMIEIIWTIIPIFLLFMLIMPSLKILYLTDEIINPLLKINIMGNQWYWNYELLNNFNIELNYDSFMLNNCNKFRLLSVDNNLILPNNIEIQLLISSNDVIHSFTLPSLGIKIDALPGRLNQTILFIENSGIYFGQCSEICGINHSFMPIILESIKYCCFLNYLKLL